MSKRYCKFCDEYRVLKMKDQKYMDRTNSDPDGRFEVRNYYKLAIMTDWKRREKTSSYWKNGDRHISGKYSIKYCPECGRKF